MASCKFNASNGKQSMLYDKLSKLSSNTALKNWAMTRTPAFQNWFGNGLTDVNGEPSLNEFGEFVNEQGDTMSIARNQLETALTAEMTVEDMVEQIETLTDIFSIAGVDVDVEMNADMLGSGSVVTLNGVTTVELNPRKIKKDTIFHEFGHILVDLFNDKKLIEKGIESLRGTELEKKLKKIYSHLSEEDFGKELLTTAIGIEAANEFDYLKKYRAEKGKSIVGKIKNWKFWFFHFLKQLGKQLGIGQTPAKKLAYHLTGSQLQHRFTKKPVNIKKQFQTNAPMTFEEANTGVQELARYGNTKIVLTADETAYQPADDKSVRLRRTTTVIENWKGPFDTMEVAQKVADSKGKELEEILELWADKREEGTGIHQITEDYIAAREKGLSREDAIEETIGKLFVPDKAGKLDKDNIRYYSGMDETLVRGYIGNLADFIDNLLNKGYKLYPEVKISDNEMGVAGTIDLLIVKPDGNLMIYDWKTKERGKFDNFYSVSTYARTEEERHFLEEMAHVKRTKANEYSLQLSIYKLMLERKGFNVDKLAIIPVVGEIVQDDKGENRYANLEIDVTDVTQRDADGVLPLAPLDEDLNRIFFAKEDVEGDIEENEINEVEQEMLRALRDDLDTTNKWIKETIVDLTKSISRMNATASVEEATKYAKFAKLAIQKLMNSDEAEAIISYTSFVTASLQGLMNKLSTRIEYVSNEDGSVTPVMHKGYSHMNWQDIKNLEENNPEGFMEFLAFLINADTFLNQIVKINQLPSSSVFKDPSDLNKVNKILTDNLGRINEVKRKINVLNKELDTRYVELSSNPLYGGRGNVDNIKDFFMAQLDENFFQRNMDALADTHNSYMANVIRMYDYKMHRMREETREMKAMWNSEVEKLEKSGSKLSRMIDETSGKVIPKLDYEAYYENKSRMYAEASERFTKGTNEYRNFINQWFKDNTEFLSTEEQKAKIDQKRKELTKKEFLAWQSKQYYKTKRGTFLSLGSELARPKKDKYTHARYKTYTKAEIEFHNYLTNTLGYLVEHAKSSIVKNGYIPSVPINDKDALTQLMSNAGWRDSGIYDQDMGVVVNSEGELVQFLPFQYNNLLNQEKYEYIDPKSDAETKKRLRAVNKEIKEKNRKAHAAAINMDLNAVMPLFIESALKNKHKKAMEFELLRVKKSFIENHKVLVTKNGKTLVDKVKMNMPGFENEKVDKSTKGSKILGHYEDWLKMVFYEEFENDEGVLQKIARVLQNYTSFKGMALNPLSAINNQVYGSIMSRIEKNSGQFFSSADWRKARMTYAGGIVSYMSDNENATTKQNAFLRHFNIAMDFRELAAFENQNQAMASKALRATSWVFNKAYFMEHASEHNLQNRVLIAMAYSHRVVDGVIMNFEEFKRGKLETIDYKSKDKEAQKEAMKRNKEKLKTLKEEFKTYTQVYEAYEFKNNSLKVKEGIDIKKNEMAEFERKVLGVNQYLHGIYNKEDAGAMQQHALGRLAIQFRKWMRPGWNKRWGSKFGQSYWNERRSVYEEGMYVTTIKFAGRPIFDQVERARTKRRLERELKEGKIKEDELTDDDLEALASVNALKEVIRGYSDMFTRAKVHWFSLNESERANVIRTMLEYATFTTAVGLVYALKYAKGEDEEPPYALMLALYQLDRTCTEFTTYVPLAATVGFVGGGWLNESKKILKSPAATFNTMESLIKISKEILTYFFKNEEDLTYKTGVYHGQNKLQVQITKAIPFYNQINRISNLYKNYRYYKLF